MKSPKTKAPSALAAGLAHPRRIAVVFVALILGGCATAGSGPPTVAVRVAGNVPDAAVWIDDHLVGRVSDFAKPGGRRLGVGFHRVEVRAPGYYSVFQEVDVKPGADISIPADLHELLQ